MVVLPVGLTVLAVASNVDEVKAFVDKLPTSELPPAPAWVAKIPVVGEKAVQEWNANVALGAPALIDKMQPYVTTVARWLAAETGDLGAFLVQFLLTVAIAAVMFAGGETAVRGLKAFAKRLGGEQGESTVALAGGAIRGVAMGVVVTSIVQALFAGIGLWIAGVSFTAVLTAHHVRAVRGADRAAAGDGAGGDLELQRAGIGVGDVPARVGVGGGVDQ